VRVAGVDGCRGGWLSAVVEDGGVPRFVLHSTFAEVLTLDAEVIGVDMPIGLLDRGWRPCDLAARDFVGPRRASVFPTPPRAVLEAPDYEAAVRESRRLTGMGVSRQSYGLRRRIFEVDSCAARDERVIEVHPEVSFCELAGEALPSKHMPEGHAARKEVLVLCDTSAVARSLALDALDAAAVAWTAARYARGDAEPLPAGHERRIGAIWR
jgi:predicted RNase H-like nuclease